MSTKNNETAANNAATKPANKLATDLQALLSSAKTAADLVAIQAVIDNQAAAIKAAAYAAKLSEFINSFVTTIQAGNYTSSSDFIASVVAEARKAPKAAHETEAPESNDTGRKGIQAGKLPEVVRQYLTTSPDGRTVEAIRAHCQKVFSDRTAHNIAQSVREALNKLPVTKLPNDNYILTTV